VEGRLAEIPMVKILTTSQSDCDETHVKKAKKKKKQTTTRLTPNGVNSLQRGSKSTWSKGESTHVHLLTICLVFAFLFSCISWYFFTQMKRKSGLVRSHRQTHKRRCRPS
jgi:hypothetical protein